MTTYKTNTLKIPLSKELTNYFIIPCLAITGEALFDLCTNGQKRLDLNVVVIFIFGLPTIFFAWFLLDKKSEFRDNDKVRKKERLFRLPFSSFVIYMTFFISFLPLIGGLASVFADHDTSNGVPLLIFGLFLLITTCISIEHRKIWLSDSSNLEDMIEKIENTPKENLSSSQDGIFSYHDSSFTIQVENKIQTIKWSDITLIKAYKIDLYTVDCIVIEIYLAETCFTINDQTPGHMKFMETASDKLSNFKKDWFPIVAFPAFETNLTIIYERQSPEDKQRIHEID